MEEVKRDELDERLRAHLESVEASLEDSFCPHSGLCVSAGLILESGQLITGVNYESAAYGLTQCAERNAIARAQTEGKAGSIQGLILSARHRATDTESPPLTPCGACRQWLSELSARLGHDIVVYSFWNGGQQGLKTSASELLPKAFR
jgi:cytidine deaminase